jgi:hypothetical protein
MQKNTHFYAPHLGKLTASPPNIKIRSKMLKLITQQSLLLLKDTTTILKRSLIKLINVTLLIMDFITYFTYRCLY